MAIIRKHSNKGIEFLTYTALLIASSEAWAQDLSLRSNAAPPSSGTAADIRQITGAQTRFVWLQGDKGYHYTGSGNLTRLMAFGTDDGLGERQVLKDAKSFSKPVITPDGQGIVFSDRDQNIRHCYYVNWDGSGMRDLGKGFASDVWRDPETKRDWVYIRRGAGATSDRIIRRRLDKPEVEESVWRKSKNGTKGVPWFQLSADGLRFSNAFPWPHCSMGNLETDKWKKYISGCWPSIAPDNSYRMFVFSGNHVEIGMYDEKRKNHRMVNVSNIPGKKGGKVYFPRWSNDVGFLTITAPENNPNSQLYIGKFDRNFNSIDRWVKVTNNKYADLFGDAWINPVAGPRKEAVMDRSKMTTSSNTKETKPKMNAKWPGTSEGLVWIWENANAQNEAPALKKEAQPFSCRGTLSERARFGRHYELLLDGGIFTANEDAGARIAQACKASKAITVEALIESFDSNQKGPARIISLSKSSIARNFTLGQEGEWLVLRVRTGSDNPNGTRSEAKLCKLIPNSPLHILVSHRDGETVCYLNGKEIYAGDQAGGLGGWEPMPLLFGNEFGGGRNWKGSLQSIAISNRFIGPQEAAEHFNLVDTQLKDRQPAKQTVVTARLVETTKTPTLDEMGTYRRALIENVYEVTKVTSGAIPGGASRIIVNQWVVMDRKTLPSAAKFKQGFSTTLTLESMSDHPELASEFRSSDHSEFNAQSYYDIKSHR